MVLSFEQLAFYVFVYLFIFVMKPFKHKPEEANVQKATTELIQNVSPQLAASTYETPTLAASAFESFMKQHCAKIHASCLQGCADCCKSWHKTCPKPSEEPELQTLPVVPKPQVLPPKTSPNSPFLTIGELNANVTWKRAAASLLKPIQLEQSSKPVQLHNEDDLRYVQQRLSVINHLLKCDGEKQTISGDASLLFGGDIFLTPEQVDSLMLSTIRRDALQGHRKRRAVVTGFVKRWPSTVPYTYAKDAANDEQTVFIMESVMQFWSSKTCLNFTRLNDPAQQQDFIVIDKNGGCSSFKGRKSGPQALHCGPNCERFGVMVHELGHALGLWHEHQRPDRDEFLEIRWNSIDADRKSNFYRCESPQQCKDNGIPYDYGSVMHYASTAFTMSDDYTLVPKVSPKYLSAIGSREFGPTFYDVMEINKAYCRDNCHLPGVSVATCQNGGYPHPGNCAQCLCPEGFSGDFCETVEPGKPEPCGTKLALTYRQGWFNLSSPNHPTFFQKGQRCSWIFEAPKGGKLQLEFSGSKFSFEKADSSPLCYASFVELRLGPDLANTGLRFCGYTIPEETFTSTSNRMLVLLRSLAEVADQGFSARVRAIRATDVCFPKADSAQLHWNRTIVVDSSNNKNTVLPGIRLVTCKRKCMRNSACSGILWLSENQFTHAEASCTILLGSDCATAPLRCVASATTFNQSAFYANTCFQEAMDCVTSEWNEWSKCSRLCSSGETIRTRVVLNESRGAGRRCTDVPLTDTQPCNTQPCAQLKAPVAPTGQDICQLLSCGFESGPCKWNLTNWFGAGNETGLMELNPVTGIPRDSQGNKSRPFIETHDAKGGSVQIRYSLSLADGNKTFRFKYWLAAYGTLLKLCVNSTDCVCNPDDNSASGECLWADKFGVGSSLRRDPPTGPLRSWRPCGKQFDATWDCTNSVKVEIPLPPYTNTLTFVSEGISENSFFTGLDSFDVVDQGQRTRCTASNNSTQTILATSTVENGNNMETCFPANAGRNQLFVASPWKRFSKISSSDIDNENQLQKSDSWDGSLGQCKQLCFNDENCQAFQHSEIDAQKECFLFDSSCRKLPDQCLPLRSVVYWENLCHPNNVDVAQTDSSD